MTQVDPSSSTHAPKFPEHQSATHSAARSDDDLPRGRHATPWGQGFSRSVGWTILGTFVPGAGLVAAGRRRLGVLVLVATAALILILVLTALFADPIVLVTSLTSDPRKLLMIAALFGALFIGWTLVILITHATTRRYAALTQGQRVLTTVLVASLVGFIALPAAKAGSNAIIAHDLLNSVFGSGGLSGSSQGPDSSKADPWEDTTRVNVLLMGGDSGDDRIGVRPDTLIVASINTQTGDTVLVSLPRNLQRVPFPSGSQQDAAYPNGFYCLNADGSNTECLLNGLWQWGEDHPDYYPGEEQPGLTATVEAVQILTGLHVDNYVMLNLRGFAKFINAMGGLTLNVKQRLPIGDKGNPSEWIEAGTQHLDGYHALWYARSRATTSDFDRMRRQRCVIGAVTEQTDPVKLAIAFPDVAAAMKTNLQTSIPLQDVDAWVILSQRVKKAQVRSLAFTDEVINTTHPDVDEMKQMVSESLDPPVKSTATSSSSPSAGSSSGSSGSSSSVAENVKDVC